MHGIQLIKVSYLVIFTIQDIFLSSGYSIEIITWSKISPQSFTDLLNLTLKEISDNANNKLILMFQYLDFSIKIHLMS